MRFEFDQQRSRVLARMHAFLHKATASTTAVSGWFEIESPTAPTSGPVSGVAEVAVADFDFGNRVLERMARQWIKEGASPILRFELRTVRGAPDAADIAGELSIGDRTAPIVATASVDHDGSGLVIAGTWPLSQRTFRLATPPGVRDRVDIDFHLVARPEGSG